MDELLTIGEIARRAGVATSALRYYDDLGLLDPVKRVSGQRRYSRDAVGTVGAIRFFQDVGFTLAEVKRLVESRKRSPRAWRGLAERKLDEVRGRLAKLDAARVAIEHALACPQDDILRCPNFWRVVGGVLEGQTIEEAHLK